MPADQEPPSYEVLAGLVASLRAELTGTRAELTRALERIAELEARLAQSPRNSSRPPSSEGLAKPAPRSLRKKSGRRPGGQDGHKGQTLAQVARPDREVVHEPGCCGRCGAGLAGRPVTWVERRQVFDLPPVRAEVTEHQLIERECGCGQRTRAAAPPGAEAPACYGPRVAAVIIFLYAGQFLSKQRTAAALAELFGIPLSPGTVAALTARAAGKLDGFLEHARRQIACSAVAGFDETGFRVDGRLAWVHCARTGKYTLLMVHPRRGRQAMEAMGVLPGFGGVAVHDAWSPYDGYASGAHQLCCAHALRELQAVTDTAHAGEWCWATQAGDALTAMQKLVSQAAASGRDAVHPAALAAQIHAYHSAAVIGASQTAARSSPLMRKHHALARRLIDRQDDYLRFTRDFRAPPDNNGCERDIRMAKLRQKVSGCLRTMTGARQFCAIRSYLSTAAKHGLAFFDALVMLTSSRPWMPANE
ncbi:MAG TPA: IS66 family transposase [Streptosporangiaceae bacterium]|nr:IS66 family transposase [Streptosporangiaceae bacterium]